MHRAISVGVIFGLFLAASQMYSEVCLAEPGDHRPQDSDPNTVRAALDRLGERAANLQSYQCKVDYLFKQILLESQSRRKGVLYYAKLDSRSYLRIDFNTLQQNDENEQKAREQFLFDGVWLTYVDYELQSVERRQMAEPNEPVDAFTLVSRRVPMVGFSQVNELEKQFEIELVRQERPASCYQLHMKVKPDSIYKDDYVMIDFWVDKKDGLPTKIVAVDADQDIHEIVLTGARINDGIRRSVFNVDIPASFSRETVPLKRGRTSR